MDVVYIKSIFLSLISIAGLYFTFNSFTVFINHFKLLEEMKKYGYDRPRVKWPRYFALKVILAIIGDVVLIIQVGIDFESAMVVLGLALPIAVIWYIRRKIK